MTHTFDPSHKQKLESDFRKKILPKEPFINFISSIAPEERGSAVELGPGTGYFTLILARYFQKVYGIEQSVGMVDYLADRLRNEGIKNVGLIVSERPYLDFEVDLAFFGNVLHEVHDPESYLQGAKKITVIDWRKEETSFGPPVEIRISEERMVEWLESRGYRTYKIDAYQYHYFIVGERIDGKGKKEDESYC